MEWVVLLHVASAFLFVGGLIGRNITLMMARTSQDIRMVAQFLALAGRFESWLVIPGSIAVLLLGLLAAFSEHLSFFADGNRWLLLSLVIYLATMILVPTVFLPRGKRFEAAMTDATSRGEVTPELSAAFRDPVVAFARNAEAIGLVVIVALMVVKPF
jgi:uncharacterized membrane protein